MTEPVSFIPRGARVPRVSAPDDPHTECRIVNAKLRTALAATRISKETAERRFNFMVVYITLGLAANIASIVFAIVH